jgi:hypothetical protein
MPGTMTNYPTRNLLLATRASSDGTLTHLYMHATLLGLPHCAASNDPPNQK